MKEILKTIFVLSISIVITSCGQQKKENADSHAEKDITANEHAQITTPDEALAELVKGNQRFVDGALVNTDYKEQIEKPKMISIHTQ